MIILILVGKDNILSKANKQEYEVINR